MQMVNSSVVNDIIARLTQIQEEIRDLAEELEILSDEELMRDIEVSRKDFEEGISYTLRTNEDIDEFFSEVQ
jgi:hypothetical protein